MRICKNKITDHIRELFGANPLRVPETRIQPLTLIEIQDRKPQHLGQFQHLVRGNFPHEITEHRSTVADVSDQRTKKIGFDLGFKILENFLKAFKMDPVQLSLSIQHSKKMAFSFSNVERRYIEPLALGKILSENNIIGDPNNFMIQGDVTLALITDVLVSDNFSLSTYSEQDHSVDIDVPLIEQYISNADLKIEVEKKHENEVKFSGPEALTFAFSCVEIKIDPHTGRFSRGEWINNIRAAKSLTSITEADVQPEDWNQHSKLMIDDRPANPLLLEF